MTGPESVQTALTVLAVGGIGGVWYRLGSLTAKTDAVERRITRVEERQNHAAIIAYQ